MTGINGDHWRMSHSMSQLPIGVFDSGVGGLTVLAALQRHLPHEDLLYLGDTARVPYGTKSPESVTRYALQAAACLAGRGVKSLVVACNTVSGVALEALRLTYAPLPVEGVIVPGAQAACELSPGGRIAVLATEGTVQGGAYQRAIAGARPDARVVAQPCSLLVSLAEEGWLNGPIVEAVIARYLAPLFGADPAHNPDTLVLGCTHFPVLAGAIHAVLGGDVTVVDSADTTAVVAKEHLQQTGMLRAGTRAGSVRFLVTDNPGRFARVARIFAGHDLAVADIELVDLSLAGDAERDQAAYA